MGGMNDDRQRIFGAVPEGGCEGPIGIDLLRAKCGKPILGIALSDGIVGAWTHYFRRRTSPCVGEGCEACGSQSPRRWLGYVALFDESTQKPFMVELTVAAARQLTRDFAEMRTMRGAWVIIERMSKRPNGRVVAGRCIRAPRTAGLPECPDLERILLYMWHCPDRQLRLLDESPPAELGEVRDSFGRKLA